MPAMPFGGVLPTDAKVNKTKFQGNKKKKEYEEKN